MRFLQRFQSCSGIFDHSDGTTVFWLQKAVLWLLLLLVAVTPLLQLNSLDRFPVATDDIEMQAIYCLLSVGMLLVFALALRLVPVLMQWKLFVPAPPEPMWGFIADHSLRKGESPPLSAPLRI